MGNMGNVNVDPMGMDGSLGNVLNGPTVKRRKVERLEWQDHGNGNGNGNGHHMDVRADGHAGVEYDDGNNYLYEYNNEVG
eukprot:CAMPEP_0184695250 /NCGR_PEP_ID=MMETSP0313-20130426/2951_1 /TAXON_ID=2792 /ORGANISM="Porphyridium aerugineum, Strain SAG 1380-2" /LENGTH=79 /DNA_ID=CAMNT_0027153677 /DNA_START=1 /DNA_END=236 /DNA_ORIENTATION=+